MNWRDGSKKEPETNSSRIWGKLLDATSTARQKVTEKYYDIREGGNQSDDDTPDNTHTQRVLAQYYLDTEGALPPWLPPPPNLSHRPSNSSSASSSAMYPAGNKPVSLQDIYDSAGSNSSSTTFERRSGRSVDLYDQGGAGTGHRPSVARDRLRGGNLRPPNLRTQSSPADQGDDSRGYNRGWGGSAGYSGRSGFGIGEDYDPYSYQKGGGGYDYGSGRDQRQGQTGGGGSSRQGGRR